MAFRMRRVVAWVIAVLALAVGGASVPPALAQPQIPATFFGSASIDGRPVDDGTEVRGYIDGKDCTQPGPAYQGTVTDGGVSAYSIVVMHESQEPGCGSEGKTVTFTVGGQAAEQTSPWSTGSPIRLDLNAGAGQPIPLPTPTPSPTIDPARPTATTQPPTSAGEASPALTPRTGTPPTDDIELPGTPGPPGEPTSIPVREADDDNEDGTTVAVVLGGGLLVLALAGGAAGYLLSRRGRGTGAPK
jgi:hypothetical protein